MAHSGPFHRFWGFPSQFLRGHMLSRVWVNIIMCDLRFFFLEGTTSWKFHRKEIENQGRAGCKNVKIHRSKCVKWELPKGFNCLRLCILLTTKIEPNKLSGFFFYFFFFFKQIPWARNQRKPYSACIASGSRWSSHCSNPPQSGLISDQFWRVWQQKVLTSPMKGLLSPDWAHRAWILFAPLPRQGRSFKQSLYMSPGKGQGEPRRERAPV